VEFPVEVALDPRGGIAVVTEERRVQHISVDGVRTIAGTTAPGFSGDGGPATAARLDQPTSIAYDVRGNLFITELGGRIRRVDGATGTISTFAGSADRASEATVSQRYVPSSIARTGSP